MRWANLHMIVYNVHDEVPVLGTEVHVNLIGPLECHVHLLQVAIANDVMIGCGPTSQN